MKKTTFAVIVGNRGFFPDHLAKTGRKDILDVIKANGYKALAAPPGVGGRFSVLTPVGLFPAAASGINIDQLLAGAAVPTTTRPASGVPSRLSATKRVDALPRAPAIAARRPTAAISWVQTP